MLHVLNPTLHAIYQHAVVLEWGWTDTSESLASYRVQILRACSEAGPWEIIRGAASADATPSFIDANLPLIRRPFPFYYRIRVYHVDTPEGWQDYGNTPWLAAERGDAPIGGVTLEHHPSPIAAEMARRFELYLDRSAEHVLHLTIRTTGLRCADCWDALKRRISNSTCRNCYGSGFAGGYFAPIPTRMLMMGQQEAQQLTGLFEIQRGDAMVWCARRPRILRRDLLITVAGRFRVLSSEEDRVDGAPVRQTVQIRPITRDQVEYAIPIDPTAWGRNLLTASAAAPMTAATDLESYRDAFNDMRRLDTERRG